MQIFETVDALQAHIAGLRAAGHTIGFAPTMGALHEGHLALIKMAHVAGHETVASIFVNPTQFNDPKDLEKYPRTPERDATLLTNVGCDMLFMPPVSEVYPPGKDLAIHLDFGALAQVMEGRFRPGHFAGMATVVKRLLDIVQPDALYMGQKDYQQLSIVRDMLRQLKSPIHLVMCPTLREPDGLAMSSRNVRLTPEMRAIAPVIHQTLQFAKQAFRTRLAPGIEKMALERLVAAGLRPEYFEIVDGVTLQPVRRYADAKLIVACTAAFAGEIRLIDNIVLKGGSRF
jgi:pantoate--beta-alanine ligase